MKRRMSIKELGMPFTKKEINNSQKSRFRVETSEFEILKLKKSKNIMAKNISKGQAKKKRKNGGPVCN